MKYVLDTSAIIEGCELPSGDLYITPGVAEELGIERSYLIDIYSITVLAPPETSIEIVEKAAEESGFPGRVSHVDIEVIALAHFLSACVVTNDFGIQNLCRIMGIKFISPRDTISEIYTWVVRCRNCGRYLTERDYLDDKCLFCGGEIKYVKKKYRTQKK